MSYRLHVLPRAEADFRFIFSHIEERSPQGAVRWREALESALGRLEDQPSACGYAPEREDTPHDLRQILFRTKHGLTYRAVFLIEHDAVYVLRIRGPGQRPLLPEELPLDYKEEPPNG